ncbi:MAG TPA: transglycosylase SLT domain-containing protein [Steroidobacteraceae bacterium]|jgi:soluble lytic murein transglycosylase-like protein|nr:transglycosylase SLT domain-containing protein [Steroidobacteraceae bacterium]
MTSRSFLLTAGACVALLSARAAVATIFAFTDPQGTVHYSNVPVDTRYQVVIETAHEGLTAGTASLGALLRKSAQYSKVIETAARASRLEPALVQAVMVAESGGDPNALSKRGARGLMQLMPATARLYGVRNAFDPEQNVRAASQYLRALTDRYQNDLELVLAAYNAGPAAVDLSGGKIPPLRETLDYVPRVLRIYSRLRELARTP